MSQSRCIPSLSIYNIIITNAISYVFDCIAVISPTYVPITVLTHTHILLFIYIYMCYNITFFTIICEFVTRPCAALIVVCFVSYDDYSHNIITSDARELVPSSYNTIADRYMRGRRRVGTIRLFFIICP